MHHALTSWAISVLTDHNYFLWVSNIFIFITESLFVQINSMMLLETRVIVFLSPLNNGGFLKLPFCGNASKFDWLIKKLLIECNTNLLLLTS